MVDPTRQHGEKNEGGPVASRILGHHFGGLNVVETQTSYKCVACGMTKTVPADQKAPSCCGKEMQKTAAPKSGENKGKEGSCCSGE